MGKNNQLTDGVFGPIIGNNEHLNFILLDDELGIQESPELKRCTDLYAKLLFKNKEDLDTLVLLEETIIQLRCKEAAKKDFKLSEVRGFIYARSSFFRKGKHMKDIRVVVGKISDYGNDLDALFANKPFVIQAKEKLQNAINEQIKDNMIYINELEEKIFSL